MSSISTVVKTTSLEDLFNSIENLKLEFKDLDNLISEVFDKPTYSVNNLVIDYDKSSQLTHMVVDYSITDTLTEEHDDEIPTLKEFMEAHGLL